jgi:hypothetical protein
MDAENNGASGRVTDIHTPFAAKTDKVPSKDGAVESLIPDMAGLLHAVDAFEEPPHPVMFARGLKTGWLFYEHGFVRWEDPVEKSCLNVELS